MTINERIKELRKEKGLTQSEFGARINLKQSAASKLEQDGANVVEQNIRLICETFHVNEEWLRHGTGEKQVNEEDTFLKKLADKYSLPPAQDRLLRAWLHLKPADREHFLEVMRGLVAAADEKESRTGIDIEQETADYHAELEAQEKAQSPSAGTSGTAESATEKQA